MATLKLQRTAKGVIDSIAEDSEWLTDRQWKLAAKLAAVVRLPGSGSHNKQKPATGFLTCDEFAARGIRGLRKGDTVRLYVQRWLDANDGEYPELGKTVVLPDDEWPPTRTGTDGYESDEGLRRTIDRIVDKHGAATIASAIVDNRELVGQVGQEQLNRAITPEQRRDLVDKGRRSSEQLEQEVRGSHAALADHTHHEVELELMSVESGMRRAVAKKEQYPYFSEAQRARTEEALQRIGMLMAILRKDAGGMSDEDRAFLDGLGITT